MAWNPARTWVANELVTASIMNTHVRDNLNALKSPPSDQWNGEIYDGTSSATWGDIDAVNLSLTITTTGGDVRVGYIGMVDNAFVCYFDIAVDGSRQSGNANGYVRAQSPGAPAFSPATFVVVIPGLAAGSHTFTVQYKGDGSNVNSLTSTHFWVSESG